MFQRTSIELKSAGSAGPLVLDYLSGDKALTAYYHYPPTSEGFKAFIESNPYPALDRKTLCDVLTQQSNLVSNTSALSQQNIKALISKNTYTVTTGHQLCLFTGPLYFIYKIITTISLSERLNKDHPAQHFVPVYWMASEDHDFEEVNHFYSEKKRFTWTTQQKGAVGRFGTKELESVLEELKTTFGHSEKGDALISLFYESYLQHKDLSQATRYLVNTLFGDKGIVIIDPDVKALKSLFKPEMTRDAFDHLTHREIDKSSASLEALGYNIQVHPREVNLFLLKKNDRVRIDRSGEQFICGTDHLEADELRHLIEEHPDRLSPNVSLRPLYQQKVLPNLAYIGGPGELAYWLQYKAAFDAHGVTFPILMPRNFFTVLDGTGVEKFRKAGLEPKDAFMPAQELVRHWQRSTGREENAEAQKEKIRSVYQELLDKAKDADVTLNKHVEALLASHLAKIDQLVSKINRSHRQKADVEIKRLLACHELLFPSGTPQERILNFSSFYLLYGSDFIPALFAFCDPFTRHHNLLEEK